MIEDIVFAKKKVCFDKLVDKGFVKMDEGDFIYSERFMDDMFEAQVIVDRSGHVSGRVVDLELGENYLPLRVASENTTFTGQVRQAYQGILQKIADTCFVDELFMSAQANRVADHLSSTYGDVFDHPFEKYPDYISFRVGRKWYALILPLAFSKLDEEGGDKLVEVVNIKVLINQMSHLLNINGVYPAYHMSKKSWVSIVLDDSLEDDVLFELLDVSRQLAMPRHGEGSRGDRFWLIPANPKVYDIDSDFSKTDQIDWTVKNKLDVGDIVGIYMTATIKSLRYLCCVVARKEIDNHLSCLTLKLVKQFPDDEYSLAFLQSKGVKSVRSIRHMTKDLAAVFKAFLE